MERTFNRTRVQVVRGDITKEAVDALVNAANAQLAGGGGVDGAIHRAGGSAIMQECDKLGGCPTGSAKATTAGRLAAKWVIHAVGPRYRDGNHKEAALLEGAYWRSLAVAAELGAKSVAFPAISCGVYGYPIPAAAAIAVRTVREFAETNEDIELVRFVLFGEDTFGPFWDALKTA